MEFHMMEETPFYDINHDGLVANAKKYRNLKVSDPQIDFWCGESHYGELSTKPQNLCKFGCGTVCQLESSLETVQEYEGQADSPP